MRNLLILVCLFFATNAMATIQHSTQSNYKTNDGSVGYYDRIFIRVKASTGITKGMVVGASLTADDGMTVSPIDNVFQKPLCVMAETLATDAWGKCQIYGYSDTVLFSGSVYEASAGSAIYTSGVAGYGISYPRNVAGASSYLAASPSFSQYGMFLDDSTYSSGAVELFINVK